MPYPTSASFPCTWADDTGVVVDSLLRSGNKHHGKTVVLIAEKLTQEKALSTWAQGKPLESSIMSGDLPDLHSLALGIKARFEQVSPADHKKRMMGAGLPEHLAVCVTELSENLMFEGETLFAEQLVQAKDVCSILDPDDAVVC